MPKNLPKTAGTVANPEAVVVEVSVLYHWNYLLYEYCVKHENAFMY